MATGEISRPWPFYLGVACVAAALMMLQVILTRIISVTSWYHLAFFVISIAMFGMTAGAIFVYRSPARYRTSSLRIQLIVTSLAFAASIAASVVLLLSFVTGAPVSFMSAVIWFEVAVVAAVPFFFSGLILTLALTKTNLPIGRVYCADLVGAAIGCLAVLAVLNLADGPTAVLWTSLLPVLASFLFAGSGSRADGRIARRLGELRTWQYATLAALLGLCLLNTVTGAIRPVMIKDSVERASDLILDRWNSFSRITVKRTELSLPPLAGPSPGLALSPVEQRWMTIDGAAGTGIYRFSGDLNEVAFLKSDVTAIAYAIPGLENGAVIGVGGGRDILTALLFGLKTVVGVELNPIFGQLLLRDYADFTALARHPGVTIEVDEARSWFSRTTRSFDIVQMSLIDTWAATGAGAFTLSENGLYTVEGWRMFLRRLTAPGVFTVSRWYSSGDFSETGRMISLAMASLLAEGASEPRRHIFVATSGNVATLVLGKEPLSAAAVDALRRWTLDKGFQVLAMPGAASPSGPIERILEADSARNLDAISATSFLDISAPTDSRPFFFNQLKLSSLLDPGLAERAWQPGVFGGNLVATITLASLVLISLMLVVAVILVPLRSALSNVDGTTVFAATTYFAMIGAGFMLAEIGLLQRLGIFLGHPVYGLSVVLFGLIVSTGIGSLVSERHPLFSTARLIAWAAALGGYLALLPWLGAALFERFEHVNVGFRQALCVALIFPAGILMGFGFPTGLSLARRADGGLGPWLWGINGAAGVLASGIAVLLSIQLGIDVVFYIAAACYLVTAAAGCVLQASLPTMTGRAVEAGVRT
jgi:hypothetical protein